MRIPQSGTTRLACVCAFAAFFWARSSRGDEVSNPRGAELAREAPLDVRFEPDEDGVALLVRNGVAPYVRHWRHRRFRHWALMPSYSTACLGTCDARFMPGTYDLALEKGFRIAAAEPLTLTHPAILRGHYTDRSGLRVAGVVLGIGGVIAGSIMIFESVHREGICDRSGYCYFNDTVDAPLLASGIGVVIGSVIAGSILAWQRDEARFTVFPLTVSALMPREGARFAAQALPEGAGVRVAF
jgi:hypothetical protein